jgi:hypothetical protein
MKSLIAFFILITLITVFSFAFGDDFIIDEPGSGSNINKPNTEPVSQPPAYAPPSAAGKAVNSIGSVPIPVGLGRGTVYSEFTMYDSGGVNAKFAVGIMDAIDIGISENLDGLIGSGDVNVNVPSAYIKITLIKNLNNFNWALGYDNFAYGTAGTYYPTNTNETPSTISGFYTAVGWHYSAIGGDDILSTGIRFPLLPAEERDITNTSLFIGATISAPQYISLGLTVENFFFDMTRAQYILPSVIFNIAPSPPFNISLILQYDFSVGRLNRIFSMSYAAGF